MASSLWDLSRSAKKVNFFSNLMALDELFSSILFLFLDYRPISINRLTSFIPLYDDL